MMLARDPPCDMDSHVNFSSKVRPTIQLLLPSHRQLGFIVPIYNVVTREDFLRAIVL